MDNSKSRQADKIPLWRQARAAEHERQKRLTRGVLIVLGAAAGIMLALWFVYFLRR